MAALTWMTVSWCPQGRPSVLGAAAGAVAGLVAITPASGFVDADGVDHHRPRRGRDLLLRRAARQAALRRRRRAGRVRRARRRRHLGRAGDGPVRHGGGQQRRRATACSTATPQFVTQAHRGRRVVGLLGVMTFVILKLIDAPIGLRVGARRGARRLDAPATAKPPTPWRSKKSPRKREQSRTWTDLPRASSRRGAGKVPTVPEPGQ